MITALIFIIVLSVIIFVHELGHFIVAKWSKVKAEVFSLGFGPTLWGFRRGETFYRVRVGHYGSLEEAQLVVTRLRREPGVPEAFVASD